MVRRLFDIVLSAGALIALSPLWAIASAGIRLSSPGPLLFTARRMGRHGREFTMYKFRTMHRGAERGAAITAANDPRVYRFGRWLRASKIDELPQLINVLKGDMSIVGPRPEDPDIVRRCYRAEDLETLAVRPGLASPGSIYNYTHGEQRLTSADAVAAYGDTLLPLKLALDRVYLRDATVVYDVRIIARTVYVIVARAFGRRQFADPPEMKVLGSS